MLNMKKLRKSKSSSTAYKSRFSGDAGAFPLRQYLRAKDELISRSIFAVIFAGFAIALLVFSKTVFFLISRHGQHLHNSTKWLAAGFVLILVVVSLYRCYRCVGEVITIRQDIKCYKEQIAQSENDFS
ncbi:MAG: hypothetical protein GY752_07325 [bacterium]|nr:hypothetical protein [bacterium]MCP4799861.1 hypothetical protein [bacterium]